jgi:hypothetical protein
MNLVRRCAIIFAGYAAAATAGLIVPAGFIFIGFPDRNSLTLSGIAAALSGIVYLIVLVGGSLLIPALFVIAICEALRIRNVLAYVTFGVLVAGLLAIYAIGMSNFADLFNLAISTITGAVAGLVYWRIAGRTAGGWRKAPGSATSTGPGRRAPADNEF